MLTTMSSKQRHIILVGVFLVFLLTVSYYQYATTAHQTASTLSSYYSSPNEGQQQVELHSPLSDLSSVTNNLINQPVKQPQPCDSGNIPWLASDRQYWDGWQTKSFFLQPDGNFTLDDVSVEEGTGLCIVVLLGPVPAASKIKVESHYAPPDLITMTAIGNKYTIPITLHQYPKQANAYYANVYFRHSDAYTLKSTTEYRSYFWEVPIQHKYQPFSFDSSNMAIITSSSSLNQQHLPPCDPQQPLEGSWRNNTDHYQFIPDHCELANTQQGLAVGPLDCLQHKTIHVWGDANTRRNLKALSSPYWCNIYDDPEQSCICNDDSDDPTHSLYPWVTNHNIPLQFGQDTTVYYNSLGTITLEDWRNEIQHRVETQLAPANVVIVNMGNDDVPLSRMKPHQFARSLSDLLYHLQHNVYTNGETIIVRTPQFFGTGQHYQTSWNAGRSRAFANVVRDLANGSRLLLWDTHQLGLEYNTCRYQGTIYTKRNVIDIENQLLLGLLCSRLA
ncbi:hypothetical protein BC941DRAFT_500821 [Chlamydoabsidia padenii]|nr:hypothetical protein BC941DRAFT_500821 [Chlamydoabsidia padenii]